MQYQGKVYRPWPEAQSVLIQATLGCSNNQCTFCTMFDDKRFKVRDIDDVFADIDRLRMFYRHVPSVFLIDGNVMAMRTDKLLQILNKITATFPECEHIALYAGINDIRRKSIDELKQLKAAGLTIAYTGLESGDELVQQKIKKGMTSKQVIEGMAMMKQAGIRVLLSFIFGLGGRDRSLQHIKATTDLLNITQPEEIAPMALAIQPGSELEQEVQRGEFVLPTPLQILEEEKYLLENLDQFPLFYWGDHGNNIVSSRGWLQDNRQLYLDKVNHAIANHPITQQQILMTSPW
ncbi:radical SAM protein [Ferrimonas senticii]|uniref:radical SAM protein n=1 Tax=Ferrimonas senticii TaxID=394566 RepID=UPI000417A6A8|nr:radical SAM protein [Ferrimonas senticii]